MLKSSSCFTNSYLERLNDSKAFWGHRATPSSILGSLPVANHPPPWWLGIKQPLMGWHFGWEPSAPRQFLWLFTWTFHSKKNPAIFISCGILGRQKHFHLFRRHSTYLVWCCWTPSLWSPRWWRAWGSSRRGSSLRTWCPHPPPPLALPSPQQWGVPTAGSFL